MRAGSAGSNTAADHSEVLSDEKGATCAAFLERAAAYFAGKGITRIERVMTDNAFAYRHSSDFKRVCAVLAATQKFIKPHRPWQNGKVERLNRTLKNRMGLSTNLDQQHRTHRSPCHLARALQQSPTPQRTRRPTPHQPSDTNLMTAYT